MGKKKASHILISTREISNYQITQSPDESFFICMGLKVIFTDVPIDGVRILYL